MTREHALFELELELKQGDIAQIVGNGGGPEIQFFAGTVPGSPNIRSVWAFGQSGLNGHTGHIARRPGWSRGQTFIASPNFDQRPSGIEIDVLVIHAISLPPGCYGNRYVEALFTNQLGPGRTRVFPPRSRTTGSLPISTIRRDGELLQFVRFRGPGPGMPGNPSSGGRKKSQRLFNRY